MKFGTIIILLVVGLICLYAFAPTQFASLKSWTYNLVGVKGNTTKTVTNNIPNTNSDYSQYEEPPNSTNVTNRTVASKPVVVVKNACNNTNFAKPDYSGTTRAGKGCNDLLSDNDLTCLANPPAKYTGTINRVMQTSDPPITCCMGDGTCQWG